MTVFEVSWGAASHTGIVRDHNEDAWLAASRLFLVADGLGGHERGEVASRAVVDAFGALQMTGSRVRNCVKRCFRQAPRWRPWTVRVGRQDQPSWESD